MRVEIDNFVFIEDSAIELRDGLTVVVGNNLDSTGNRSNGSGKTLLLEAIFYCLYGVSIRGTNVSDLVGPASDAMSVTVEMVLDEGVLEVMRRRTQSSTDLKIVWNDETTSFQKNTQAQDFIDDKLGFDKHKAYQGIYYGEYCTNMLEARPSERRDSLLKLINYDQDTHDEIREDLKARSYTISNEADLRVQNLNKETARKASELEHNKRERDKVEKEVSDIESKILKLEESREKIRGMGVEDKLKNLNAKRAKAQNALNELASQDYSESIESITNDIEDLSESIKAVVQRYRDKIDEDKRQNVGDYQEFVNKYNELKGDLEEADRKIDKLEDRRLALCDKIESKNGDLLDNESRLEDIEADIEDETCTFCGQSLQADSEHMDKVVAKRQDIEVECKSIKSDIAKVEDELDEVEFDLQEAKEHSEYVDEELVEAREAANQWAGEHIEADWNKGEDVLSVTEFSNKIEARLKDRYSKVAEEKTKDDKVRYKELKSKREEFLSKQREKRDSVKELQDEIEKLEREIDKLKEYPEKIADLKSDIHTNESLLESAKGRLADAERECEVSEKEYNDLEVVNEEKVSAAREYQNRMEDVLSRTSRRLNDYKNERTKTFIRALQGDINIALDEINSDIRCKIDAEDLDSLDILFTDSSKDGEWYSYSVYSRGERTRIKKVFFQVLIELFSPPFVLSDESYDGLDEQGVVTLSEFVHRENRNRIFVETTPQDLEYGDEEPYKVMCTKKNGIISIEEI